MGLRRLELAIPILAGAAILLAGLIGLPLAWLFRVSVAGTGGGGFTGANFAALIEDPELLEPLLLSLGVAFAVALACAVVAAPLAWLIARSDLPWKRAIRLLVLTSFVTPPFLGAIAWEILAAPNSGLLNQAYRQMLDLPRSEHAFNIYSISGLVFVIATYTFPYVFILVVNGLERIPRELEEASAILGARRWRTALRVTVPLGLPALLAGTLVAFLEAMNNFGAPAIIAIPAGLQTITTKIWTLFQFPPQPGLAAAAAVPLLAVTIVLLQVQQRLLGRRSYAVVGGKAGRPDIVRLGRWRLPALLFALAIVTVSVLMPYAALVLSAFSRTLSVTLSPANLTIQHFTFVFAELSGTKQALSNSLILGVTTATAGTLLTLVIAYVVARRALPLWRWLGYLATAPIAIPSIVLGVGFFFAYTHPPFALYGTLAILFLAFLTIELPIGYQQFQAAFRSVHADLEEAGRILGAGRLRTLRDITAPLLWTAVVSTWCLVFVASIRELSAAILLFTVDTKVLSVLIYDLNESGDPGAIAVVGLLMLLITFVVIGIAYRLPRAGLQARAAASEEG
ncbi:MAG TPA: iron ABC transporter permease [Stellaceae bacterium]|nr:iron ABC transporter permease [Stellaceae bacterium]